MPKDIYILHIIWGGLVCCPVLQVSTFKGTNTLGRAGCSYSYGSKRSSPVQCLFLLMFLVNNFLLVKNVRCLMRQNIFIICTSITFQIVSPTTEAY